MKNRLMYLIIAVLIIAVSCNKTYDNYGSFSKIKYHEKSSKYNDILKGKNTGDYFTIKESYLVDEVLYVTVTYGGGCDDHSFNIYYKGKLEDENGIIITHNAHKDYCEALITETLEINLKDLFGKDYNNNINFHIINGFEYQKHEELLGTWVFEKYDDDITVLKKSNDFHSEKYGIKFNNDLSLVERKNAGWCGTPPITYDNFDGSWKMLDENTVELDVVSWDGNMYITIEIVNLTDKKLEIRYIYK